MNSNPGIEGVQIIPKRRIFDDRGAIFHMLKRNDPEFLEFGEIYFSRVYPGVVKGWHYHKKMVLNYLVVAGSIRLVLFDDRENSRSFGQTQEIYMDESEGKLVVIPPLVWNAFKGVGTVPALVANCSTITHDPEEILRKPYNDPYFKYDWSQRNH